MSRLTFKNSRGELVVIPAVAATEVKKKFGGILAKATHGGAVAITLNNSPKAVLLSYEEFQSLIKVRSRTVGELSADLDGLLARMQTPKAEKAMEAAFNASPAKVGRAAVKAGRRCAKLAEQRSRDLRRQNTAAEVGATHRTRKNS